MTTTDRHLLRFAESVEENFAFLRERGFVCVQSEPMFVRFESGRWFVSFYHEKLSYEIYLCIGQLDGGADEVSYSMGSIIKLVDPGSAAEYRDYAAFTPEGVENGVRRLASLFRRYIDVGTLEEPGFFERLAANREAAIGEYCKTMELTRTRKNLDVAWHAKDYTEVVKLLTPARDDLTPAERGKLEYAEKKIKEADPFGGE